GRGARRARTAGPAARDRPREAAPATARRVRRDRPGKSRRPPPGSIGKAGRSWQIARSWTASRAPAGRGRRDGGRRPARKGARTAGPVTGFAALALTRGDPGRTKRQFVARSVPGRAVFQVVVAPHGR